MYSESAPGTFNWEDFLKATKVFFWNTLSLGSALAVAITALPAEQLPHWMLWVVPLSGFLNAIGFGVMRWLQDNRVS